MLCLDELFLNLRTYLKNGSKGTSVVEYIKALRENQTGSQRCNQQIAELTESYKQLTQQSSDLNMRLISCREGIQGTEF